MGVLVAVRGLIAADRVLYIELREMPCLVLSVFETI